MEIDETMKRQVLLFLFSGWLLFLLCSPSFCYIQQTSSRGGRDPDSETSENPAMFFDRSVYYPPVKVFWDRNASLMRMKITALDAHIQSSFIRIKIFSSVDEWKVRLTRTVGDRFEWSTKVNCLRYDETVYDRSVFNARYGDMIIARRDGNIQASALVAFPTYVMDNFFISTYPWKLFDPQGVPLVDYGSPIGVQYNPVEVSHYALANYYLYSRTQNSSYRVKFLVQADWLLRNAVMKGNFSVWEYKFDWSVRNCTDPWVSAMAQGEGVSVLTRAYAVTGNSAYLRVAETAMRSFEVEMASGGVRFTDSDGVWYEEYADVGAISSKVLNGFIFGLFGLFEYSFATGNSEALRLFNEGTSTLALNLYRYDAGSGSYYDLQYYAVASYQYNYIHTRQLWTLYEVTGNQTFKEYSLRFNSYL